MTSFKAGRARRAGSLVLALGAVALLALSGLAVARSHHGDRHGQDSGQVASFDSGTGMLSIELTGGETVSGLVTGRTKIRCEDEHAPSVSARHGESEPGDDNGGHGEEAGDDNGGQGNEPGDDNGGDSSGPGPSQSGPSGHDDNGIGANCTESDLVVGATVHEAELDLRNGKAVFDEVELAG
ncbi:MAG TPA: hypothetical protein VIH47_00240 [Solirubrobacterales bacterium]